MPLYDYRCGKCRQVTELLLRATDRRGSHRCPHCGSPRMVRLVSRVNFNVAKKTAYSDEFMHKALPFLSRQPQTAQRLAEGDGSADARAFRVAEDIGRQIDRRLEAGVLRKRGR